MTPSTGRITHITLESLQIQMEGSLVARDQTIALKDLKANSVFQPLNDTQGPYTLTLSVTENRLVFDIKNVQGTALPLLVLSLKPYARLIKDYFMIVQSYDAALQNGSPSRIEAIDMGRRGLHNEGAGLLIERLGDKIQMDQDTARRLFTLICALHATKTHAYR